jgi:CRP-like cAMP-binding protein
VSAGHVFFEPTDTADVVFFIHRGQVRLYTGTGKNLRLLEVLGPGRWFGVAAFMDRATYGQRAHASTDSIVAQYSTRQVLSAMESQPALARSLINTLTGDLLSAQHDGANSVLDDCKTRVIRALLHFSKSAAAQKSSEGVTLYLSHLELSESVGVARETVSLMLGSLKEDNLLRTGRNKVHFNPDKLQATLKSSRKRG